jgi:hypothetical protein
MTEVAEATKNSELRIGNAQMRNVFRLSITVFDFLLEMTVMSSSRNAQMICVAGTETLTNRVERQSRRYKSQLYRDWARIEV